MSWFVTYVRSSVGAKHVMAVTGLLLVLFAIQHAIGHLIMFGGRTAYNEYAHWAQGLGHGAIKWVVRGGLLFLLVVHVAAGIRLASLNRAARPERYRVYRAVRTTPWARTMIFTGLATLAFLVYHILHFTVGMVQPEYFRMRDPDNYYDAYVMFVRGFQEPWILGSYLVGMTLLLPHLAHGISSLFQSLGLKHKKYDRLIDRGGPALALALYVTYVVPPIMVAAGVIKLPGA
jgi:succinate dehydrogenase / fumarate reductase, cytochrome b subunit